MEAKGKVRQARALETQNKIVLAAKKLISARGFDGITIEAIAKEAGVSTGSFYTYFARKEDVIEELNRSDFLRLAEIVNGMEDRGLIERLKYYGGEFFGEIERIGIEICRQWIRNNLSPRVVTLGGKKTTKYGHDNGALQAILTEAVRRGELRPEAPLEELALFINVELYGFMGVWCMTDAEVVGSRWMDEFCDMVVRPMLEPWM